MDELKTLQGLHHFFRHQLALIAGLAQPSANQLVLVTANAIMLGDHELIELARDRAASLGYLDGASEDEQVLQFIFNSPNPFALVHERTTAQGRRLQFNELRAFRPRRDSQTPMQTIHEPFDDQKFNFNVVPLEAFWKGEWRGRSVSLYFNKYPFAPYHTLIVPEPKARHEQFLQPEDHALAWDIQAYLSKHQRWLVIGYNARGANASVNHLHFQMLPDGGHLPIFRAGSMDDGPIKAAVFTSSSSAWREIDRLQSANRPFNAVYAPGKLYLMERAFQGTHQQPSWTTGFAWYEISGGIITVDEVAFKTLTDDQIEAVFEDMRPA